MSKTIFINKVRLAFPVLYKAEEFDPGDGKPRFSATFLVEPDSESDKTIRQAILDAVKEKFPEAKKAEQFLKSVVGQSQKYCYQDGDTKSFDGFEGNWFLASHRQAKDGPPAVVDQKKQPISADSGKVYAGCYVNAKVDIYVQATGNPGVRCGLLAVQFAADGDAFAGGVATPDGFEEIDSGDGNESDFY
jgi:hypothetical protein